MMKFQRPPSEANPYTCQFGLIGLLKSCGHGLKVEARVAGHSPLSWVELEPSLAADSDLAPDIVERNERWHVIGCRKPDEEDVA